MEHAYLLSAQEALKYFQVKQATGLSDIQVLRLRDRHGANSKLRDFFESTYLHANNIDHVALPEDPPTPLWQLVLEQFKDQLVIILLGSAAVSFVLAILEEGDDWTAFVDPVVVSLVLS